MPTPENQAVLFIDLLGFSSLLEKNELDKKAIIQSHHPLAGTIDEILSRRDNPLTHAFTSFHFNLKWAIELAQMKYPITAITFSDSAFIAMETLTQVAGVAAYLLRRMISAGVPARGGIGYGEFAAVRFKSDISETSGDHAAHFLGTGVVRANAAESCGIKGTRILFHPSAVEHARRHESALIGGEGDGLIGCAPDELRNRQNVEFELNFWNYNSTDERHAWHRIQEMWNAAPDREKIHYEATAAAIDRMRVSRGHPAIRNVRARTIRRRSAEI